jgi:hypothetical protein
MHQQTERFKTFGLELGHRSSAQIAGRWHQGWVDLDRWKSVLAALDEHWSGRPNSMMIRIRTWAESSKNRRHKTLERKQRTASRRMIRSDESYNLVFTGLCPKDR